MSAVSESQEGTQLFAGITASHAAVNLQVMLKNIGVEESYLYRTHDLRRGHARDLQLSGARLCAYGESNRVICLPLQVLLYGRSFRQENGEAQPS